MRIDEFGNVGAGLIGDGGVVSINALPVLGPSAQFGGWLRDGTRRLIAQSYGPHKPMLVAHPGGEVLSERGANEIRAGGGVWAAWLAGVGLFSSTGFGGPDKYLLDVGPDGAIAYTPHAGFPIKVHPKGAPLDGSQDWTLSETPARYVRLMGGGSFIRYDDHPNTPSQVLVVGLPIPVGLPRKFYGFCMSQQGEWCAYQDQVGGGRVVVRRPGDPTKGFVIPAPIAEGLDVSAVGDDARVCFARAKGEQPGDIVIRTFRVTDQMHPLDAPLPPPDDEPDEPDEPEEPVAEPIPDYESHVKRVWAKYGGTSHEAGAKVTRVVAYEIHRGINGAPWDPRVGLWQKRSASTINDRDPDKVVFLLRPNRVAFIDIVANAGKADAKPSWQSPHYEDRGIAECDDPTRCHGWVLPQPEPGVHFDVIEDPDEPDDHEPDNPPEDDPDDPQEPLPMGKHAFVGEGKFCPECGQPAAAAIHQLPAPTTGDLGAVLAQLVIIARQQREQKQAIEEGLRSLTVALTKLVGEGGLSAILDLLKKR
jgi:hypothetical protein